MTKVEDHEILEWFYVLHEVSLCIWKDAEPIFRSLMVTWVLFPSFRPYL